MRSVTTVQKSVNIPVLCKVPIAYAYSKTYEHTDALQWSAHQVRHQKPHSNRKRNAER